MNSSSSSRYRCDALASVCIFSQYFQLNEENGINSLEKVDILNMGRCRNPSIKRKTKEKLVPVGWLYIFPGQQR